MYRKDRIGHHTNKKKKVAAILSGFCRCIIARKVAISKLNTIYRRVLVYFACYRYLPYGKL